MDSCPPAEGWDSDGSLSWEDFFGPSLDDLGPTLINMYDTLVGRGDTPDSKMSASRAHWSAKVERNWNCRCTGKAASEAVTRCAACIADLRSTDIRDSMVFDGSPLPQRLEKCSLLTCPAGASPLGSPVTRRARPAASSSPFPNGKGTARESPEPLDPGGGKSRLNVPRTPTMARLPVSPLALKRLRAEGCVSRPLSVSSIASSSSSSSGTSSCSHRLGVPHKSSSYLASIESLEDTSETDRRKSSSSRGERFKCNDSQGSADSGVHSACSTTQSRPRYCDRHVSYMDRVVMEIIETEGVYVRDLQDITQGYLHVWRSDSESPLDDRLDGLFGNIEDIYHFNSKFLGQLEQCDLDPVKVARCFVSNNIGFSVYTEYCTNYPRTVSLLTELMRQETAVRLFRERQTALKHTLPLGSYLLKPVQRILKYHLLLQNIVKQSVKDATGYGDIVDALAAMTGIAQHINDMKRRHEHAVRVQEIQSLLYGWEGEDLTTYGELCAEGTFRMSGAKALRHIFLFDKILLITKKKEEGILSYKAHINCSNLMLIESVPGEPLCFHVIPFDNPRLQYTLQARNFEQKREWTLQLKRVILENYNAVIPSHARQLVMQLGQQRTDDESTPDRTLPKRHHSAPEYLERRKQDRRKSEVGFRSRLRRSRKSDAGSTVESQQKCESSAEKEKEQSLGPKDQESQESVMQSPDDYPTTNGECTPVSNCQSDMQAAEHLSEDSRTAESSRKVSIDLTNAEEVQSIEQIVGQLLMQNREFEKILKRQRQHVHLRNRQMTSPDTRGETTDEEDDGIYETLLQVKLVLAGANDESDYVTLCPAGEDSGFKKQYSLREGPRTLAIRRGGSCRSPDLLPLKLLENISPADQLNIPTLPSVWLRQQGEHLATHSKKAGSLPRSFQLNMEGETIDDAFKDARNSVERPFTIASDQPPSTMINYDDIDRYSRPFPVNYETTEDDSLTEAMTTPAESLDRINLHPDYRIYRSGLSSNALKSAIASVSNKLALLKGDLNTKSSPDENKILQWEKKASRLLYVLARQCNKSIRNHITRSKTTLEVPQMQQHPPAKSPSLPVFMQGSSGLGARIANFDTKTRNMRPSRKAAALLGIQPDSLISLTESMTSCSELEITPDSEDTVTFQETTSFSPEDVSGGETDGSIDSFYERSFEALDEEMSKSSPEYSDQEDSCRNFDSRSDNETNETSLISVPPPVPAKPQMKTSPIDEGLTVNGVEEEVFKRSKSIRERQRDLEQWRLRKEEEGDTSSQHSTASTVIEVSNNDSTRPTGWVRHVVGKLQASASQ